MIRSPNDLIHGCSRWMPADDQCFKQVEYIPFARSGTFSMSRWEVSTKRPLRERLPMSTRPHLVGEVAGGQAVAATFCNHPLRKDRVSGTNAKPSSAVSPYWSRASAGVGESGTAHPIAVHLPLRRVNTTPADTRMLFW